MKITVLEGARGTGKTTIASKLRQLNADTTLVNFTGFNTDGEEGINKVESYYKAWMGLLARLHKHDSKFVFDRFFFSEMVYSQLYKSYDFSEAYNGLLDDMKMVAKGGIKFDIFYLTVNDRDELANRLARDKVPFWKAEESVEETLKQQKVYHDVFSDLFHDRFSINDKAKNNIKIHMIDTSHKTNEEVYSQIIKTTN